MKKYNNKKSKTIIGQVFTPNYIAEFMVKNISNILKKLNNKEKDLIKVLEPSVGKGIFLENLLKYNFMITNWGYLHAILEKKKKER